MTGGLRSNIKRQRELSIAGTAAGYTIVEILIVLAVTGFIFISAMTLVNGRQATTSFNQSIRNVQSELQQVINDVGSGYYVNPGNITCTKGINGPVLTPVTSEQGSNGDCIFLGKALHFAVAGTDPEAYHVHTITGLQNGNPLTPFGTKAKLIARPSGSSNVPDAYEKKQLQYGLTITKMYYNNNEANRIGAFGIVSAASGSAGNDGSQQLNFLALTNTRINPKMSATDAVAQINGNWSSTTDLSKTNPSNGIQLCFRSGGTKQSGLITLGAQGRQGTVDLKIFSNETCT